MEVARRLRALRAPQRPGDGRRARSRRRALAPHARSGRAAWAATSSWPCCPRSPTKPTPSAWPRASSKPMREPIFVGRPGVLRHRQRRHRDVSARRPEPGRSDAQLRRGDVRGQDGGTQRLGGLQPAAGAAAGARRSNSRAHLHKAIERDELVLHYQPKVDVRAAQDGRRRGPDALAARRRAGAAGRLHPAGRGDRPDRAAVGVGGARGGAPGARSGSRASASPTRSPSTCPAGCSSAATWSRTSTSRSRPTACRTRRSSSRSPRTT